MTNEANEAPPTPPLPEISPEDLAKIMTEMPMPGSMPPSPGAMRRKLLVAVAIGAIGIGASVMSCVGQSFSYRQARALEGIEQQLKSLSTNCSAGSLHSP